MNKKRIIIFALIVLFGLISIFFILKSLPKPFKNKSSNISLSYQPIQSSSYYKDLNRSYHTTVVFKDKIWMIGGTSVIDDKISGILTWNGHPPVLNDIWCSTNGIDWEEVLPSANFSPRLGHSSVVFNDKIFVMGGEDASGNYKNDIWSSNDGKNWGLVTDNAQFLPRAYHTSFVFQNKIWVVGGRIKAEQEINGKGINDIWNSEDGMTWKLVTKNTEFNPCLKPSATVFKDTIFLYTQDKVWYSNDGILWKQAEDMETLPGFGATMTLFKKELLLIGGSMLCPAPTPINISSDGLHWKKLIKDTPMTFHAGHTSVSFQDKLWILGNGNSYYSDDGQHWQSKRWAPRSRYQLINFNNRLWIISGINEDAIYPDDIWSSKNGKSWQKEVSNPPWSENRDQRIDHQVIIFNHKLWLIGGAGFLEGFKNDVWNSINGKNWTLVTESAPWKKRTGHRCIVFNNRMWLLGGETVYPNWSTFNDIFYSDDGKNWKQIGHPSPWKKRSDFGCAVFNNKLWIMGGRTYEYTNGDTKEILLNDVWYSSNGDHWTQATPSANWSPRSAFSTLAYDNKLWVIPIAGEKLLSGVWYSWSDREKIKNKNTANDIWYTTNGKDWIKAPLKNNPFPETPIYEWDDYVTATIFQNHIYILNGKTREMGILNTYRDIFTQ